MRARTLFAEALGTALLVIFGAGAATLTFGFGITGSSFSAGVVATALVFGLVLGVLVYTIGPVSGCHINPAVTMGFLVAKRMKIEAAIGYWLAQVVGGIAGGAALYGIFRLTSTYRSSMGLGADGYGAASKVGLDATGAFLVEVVLTFVFVLVILSVTRKAENALISGLVIGLALMLVHLIGIPLDGTSVNPARSIGPALFVGGQAVRQLWVFIVAPLVGGALAAFVSAVLAPPPETA